MFNQTSGFRRGPDSAMVLWSPFLSVAFRYDDSCERLGIAARIAAIRGSMTFTRNGTEADRLSRRDLLRSIANQAIERLDHQIADLSQQRDAATSDAIRAELDGRIGQLIEDRHVWERVLELSYLA
jgi:hypothetical protein